MTNLAFDAAPEARIVTSIRAALGIAGLVSLVIGVLILVQPQAVGAVVAGFLAAYTVIAGLAYLGIGIFSRALGVWPRIGHLLLGVIFLVAGVITFANLGDAVAVLALLFGIMIGVTWIVEGIVAITLLPDSASKVWTIIYAVISILGGIALVTSPLWGAAILFLLLGIWLIVMGIVQIVRAFRFGATAAL
jgi:uncharacterized membrane protein HdeD (DUF308 family)